MSRTICVQPTTTPVMIADGLHARTVISIWNAGAQTVYLGETEEVTAAAGPHGGIPLAADIGVPLIDDSRRQAAWWAVVASGTGDVRAFVED